MIYPTIHNKEMSKILTSVRKEMLMEMIIKNTSEETEMTLKGTPKEIADFMCSLPYSQIEKAQQDPDAIRALFNKAMREAFNPYACSQQPEPQQINGTARNPIC